MTRLAPFRFAAALAAALVLVAAPATAPAQKGYEPHIGQPGKDVIWVPSPDDIVERMLRMAQTTSRDMVIDLGSGDGKIAIAAAKVFGARALGIEFNPDMVALSQKNAKAAGVADRATFVRGDIFKTDFSKATVLTMYLLPGLNMKLRPTILSMRPGTRVVSHSFSMEDWEADELSMLEGKRAYLWIVPARVGGSWALEISGGGGASLVLELDQKFQKLDGKVNMGKLQASLRDTRLRGDLIGFSFVDNAGVLRSFEGRVNGTRIEGDFNGDDGRSGRWTALRR